MWQYHKTNMDQSKIIDTFNKYQDHPLQYSRSHKHLSLGMPKASPSSSTIISFTHGTIFLFLYTLCTILRVSVCFYFQCVYVLFSGLCNKFDPCILVWERDTLYFFIKHTCSSLICVEFLVLLFLLLALVFHVSLVQSF